MKSSPYFYTASDGQKLFVNKWSPDSKNPVTGIFHIVHGMAEHSGRYAEFAEYLTGNGMVVFAHDHRGHGKSAASTEDIGWIGEHGGWDLLISDIRELRKHIKQEFPDLPHFILGHSMGSFLMRDVMCDPSIKPNGIILSGTGGDPGILGYLGKTIAQAEKFIKGKKHQSQLMTFLTFGDFNRAFKPCRSNFDWLSRDPGVVDKYIRDPACGGVFTSSFFCELMKGLQKIHKPETFNATPKDLPILFISGDKDPVGKNGKDVKFVYEKYASSGLSDVSIKLYPQGRHEMLNEINRQEVFTNITDWVNAHI